jgi:hypothetical protein
MSISREIAASPSTEAENIGKGAFLVPSVAATENAITAAAL